MEYTIIGFYSFAQIITLIVMLMSRVHQNHCVYNGFAFSLGFKQSILIITSAVLLCFCTQPLAFTLVVYIACGVLLLVVVILIIRHLYLYW